MSFTTRHRARSALGWGAALAYPVLMIVALRSEMRSAEGLRVLWPAVVMGLAAAPLRHRPIRALIAMIAGAVAVISVLGAGDVSFGPKLAVFVAVGAVAAVSAPRVSVVAAVGALGALVGAEAAWQEDGTSWSQPLGQAVGATSVGFSAQMITIAVAIGLLVRQRRRHADTLRTQATAHAMVGERLRIARELHDSVAHSIGIIALQAGAASRVFDTQPDRARQALGVVETAGRDALAELRRMLGALREADTADGPAAGLGDLPRLAAATTAAGIRVDVRCLGTPAALPPEIDRSAYRIIQEAVTNVVRHAGADSCRVIVEHGAETLSVEVLDNGPGLAGTAGAGYGLVGMRERVALLHGDFSAGPRADGGYRVAARLPVPVASR